MAEPTVEPLTWRILQAIGDRLAEISVENGYYTDLGAAPRIYGRDQEIESDSAFVVILADDLQTRDDASGKRTIATDMSVSIEYCIPFAMDNPELVAHRGRADIVRRLLGGLRGMPEGFRNLQVTSAGIVDPPDGSELVVAQVQARASLSESITPAS